MQIQPIVQNQSNPAPGAAPQRKHLVQETEAHLTNVVYPDPFLAVRTLEVLRNQEAHEKDQEVHGKNQGAQYADVLLHVGEEEDVHAVRLPQGDIVLDPVTADVDAVVKAEAPIAGG